MKKSKKLEESSKMLLEEMLIKGDKEEIRTLFAFDSTHSDQEILRQFKMWAGYFFPQYFKHKDAPFHKEIDTFNLQVYRGNLKYFVDIVFRNGAKTTRTKLFLVFAIANDLDHFRKYIKVLCKDTDNAGQFVTDVYNMLINQEFFKYYPEIFEKTIEKREERMASFTTATKIKVRAGTVGTEQRGDIQEDARPDFIIFDDIENRKTLRSAVETKAIWDNMEEAKTGLSKNGGAIYLANYLSERGNVHKLIQKGGDKKVLIMPICQNNKPTWDVYTLEEIENIKKDAEDFAGEYMCEPSAGADILFDRSSLKKQIIKEPIKIIAGFKIFHNYDASHRYGSGHDVGGGVGLDHSTSVFMDFSTVPCRIVGTFKNNTIKPTTFGDEIENETRHFGKPIVAPEKNNHGHATIGRLQQIYDNIYFTQPKDTKVGISPDTIFDRKEYGWHTNGATKPKMIFDFKKAIEDGLIELSDEDLVNEAKSYTRDDLMDKEEDPRLSTRHFDLLIAAAIAWQMRNFAEPSRQLETEMSIQESQRARVAARKDTGL